MNEADPFADLAVGLNEDSKIERAKTKPSHDDVTMAPPLAADEDRADAADDEASAEPAKRRGGRKTLFERMAAETKAREQAEAAAETADAIDGVSDAFGDADDLGGEIPAKPMDDFVEEAPEVEAIEIAAEHFTPDPSEAVQALRDYTLQIIKDLDKPWHKLPQERQVDLARAIEHSCRDVVRTIVELVVSRGQKPVRVLLKKIAAGDKIQITGEVSLLGAEHPDDSLLLLHHAIGKHVMLTRATVDDYAQGSEAETEPDEPIMDFESEPVG